MWLDEGERPGEERTISVFEGDARRLLVSGRTETRRAQRDGARLHILHRAVEHLKRVRFARRSCPHRCEVYRAFVYGCTECVARFGAVCGYVGVCADERMPRTLQISMVHKVGRMSVAAARVLRY